MISALVLPNGQTANDDTESPNCPDSMYDNVPVLVCAGWYEYGDYDGNGEAIIILEDGRATIVGLGHCSCYGPWDEVDLNNFIDYNQLKANQGSSDHYQYLFDYCEAHFAQA